uniref:SPX domain-containing protein n=1 Tax=Cannabis sativa TaxID=3483 RepID=A0A803QMI3_CANSA
MKFGKEFTTHLEDTLPEWRDKFLCYKPLKKFLKTFPTNPSDQHQPFEAVAPAALEGFEDQGNPPLAELQDWFIRILNEELDKFNDFYVDKEEEFVIRFQELKERIERVKEKSNNGRAFTSESEFSEEIMDIRRDFVAIHGEMVLLKNYSSLNFAGTQTISSLLFFLI